jgi:hypothetical protein
MPLQRAITWSNQVMYELCGAWWAAATLAASAALAQRTVTEAGEYRLWRPHLEQLPAQPDLIRLSILKCVPESTRWEPVLALEGSDEVRRADCSTLVGCDGRPPSQDGA